MSKFKFEVSACRDVNVADIAHDRNFVVIQNPADVTAMELGQLILEGYNSMRSFLPADEIAFVIRVYPDV